MKPIYNLKLLLAIYTAPSIAPHIVKAQLFDLTTVFITWKPPPIEHHNGLLRGYNIVISSETTAQVLNYSTEDPYLLISNLQLNLEYTCQVAAFTVKRGPYSDIITVTVVPNKGIHCQS